MEDSKVVDYGSQFARWDVIQKAGCAAGTAGFRASSAFRVEILPPKSLVSSPASSLTTKMAHTCVNKSKRAVYCVEWTPEGRRVLSGTMSGEFTLWHGMNFSLEMVMQAHESSVRCMRYNHAGDWLLSGDQEGTLKVWQPNFNNVKMQKAHSEVLRDVVWSPNDSKFATCSDDGSVKVWAFTTMAEETNFSGRNAHGWDVKCVDWHPSWSLLASGSKDNTLRLWDPRQSKAVRTIHEFKNTVSKAKFQPTGNQYLLAAASRDHTAHLFDMRMMSHNHKSMVLRGHPADVSSLEWHPMHPQLLTTGTHDGSIHHFVLDSLNLQNDSGQLMPSWSIAKAHMWPVWDLAYHPVGHVLASGSNDKSVRIWTRAEMGDEEADLKAPSFYSPDGEHGGGVDALQHTLQAEANQGAAVPTAIPGLDVE